MTDPPPKMAGNWAAMTQAGSALTGPVLLGLLLDWQFATLPWITLAGVLLGLFGSIAILAMITSKPSASKPDAAKPRPTDPPES